jgi:HD superfamily phosphohydrolase
MKKIIHKALMEGYTSPIRDAIWGHVYLSPALENIVNSAPFMRLCRIMQLGPVYLAYPGATHTRASHSIGVYHLSRRLLQNLAERGADEWLTPEGVKSFLCASLLHDLGHFPYTHSLKELPLRSHEALTGDIILGDPVKGLVKKTGADPEMCAAIVDKELPGPSGLQKELQFYRRLLSGALDPDKMDYLNRDAKYCGVTYGTQDVDFIFSRVYPHAERGTDIDSRLIPNVESILFSKYLMYRVVYWHRQVRSATAMIKKALFINMESGSIKGEELYNLDDQSLFALLKKKSHFKLAQAVREGRTYSAIAEIPFSETKHSHLGNIAGRSVKEKLLVGEFRSAGIPIDEKDLIIDVPEPLSFETGLYVQDEGNDFSESSSAFKADILNSFIKSLYTIRIFINSKFEEKLKTFSELHAILENEGFN